MGLSYDLISEFVKITNDKKENTKEETVYATVVSGTGGKYVRIDGSDLLTPMDTTTNIEDGERVTLMIKDHKAIVTGNVTNPSASTSKVDKVTNSVNSLSDRVGTFELVVADKVSTNELEAYKATIEVLIAEKATIEDLNATNAKVENLEAKNAEIENLVAEKATIEDLEAVNATIENLKVKDAEIENAVVENLKATTADIKILNADFAQIKTLVNGNLTSDNILSFNLTSEKVTVDDAFIKDAMIDTISAGKINAGKINTNSVSIGSEDGGMLITGSTQQFTDKNGNVRIQIGKDASGDFTFILYGEDGQGQLINQNGITASAIGDGLIVNDMVSDNAAISGGKLDISSVITEINGDNSTTIQSSKIYLNDQAQTLEVAFNSLKTQVDTFQEVTIKGELTDIVEQVQSNTSKIEANKNSINTLISEDTVIKKQVTDLQGTLSETETTLNSKYTTLSQNLDGFKTTVADTYATKKSMTDVVDNIEANYSTTSAMNSAIEQKAQEISASVSSTYATKNEVSTLDNNLRTNYSTTQQMESAINIAKEAIDLSVSNTYETKENVTTKVNDAKKELNTSINKKANSSDVYKKSEVYTKTQTDSQINIAKEAIDLSVSNTYETKENVTSKVNKINVGSVNRLTGTSEPYAMAINNTSSFTTWDPYSTPDKQTLKQLGFKVGDQITLSFNWKISKNGSNNYVYGNFRTEFVGYTSDGGKEYKGVIQNPVATFSSSNTSGRSETTVTLTEINLEAWGLRIRIDNSVLTLTISDVKMEKGNKATSWSPAPEDVESDITSIQSETKSLKSTVSSLQLGTDSISASVKSLEESMTNTTNGLSSDISRIQDQVNLKMSTNDVKLEIQKEMSKGASKVSTSTGFTFDQNGLNISKSDSEMKTQITEDGMKIYKNSEVMLTANNQGVDAKNLHATTYLIIGNNSRMEDFTENGSKRTAVFWIG